MPPVTRSVGPLGLEHAPAATLAQESRPPGPLGLAAQGYVVLADAADRPAPSPKVLRRISSWCPDHEGDGSWTVDLIWDVFHEAKENHRIWEILAGEERGHVPWDMALHANHCGTAVEATFKDYFDSYEIAYHPYYVKKLKSIFRKDLRFDPNTVRQGVAKIKALLDQGVPVRVPLIHGIRFRIEYKKIKPHHYVGIVGYKGNTFLYLEPALPPFNVAYSYVPNYAGRLVSIHVGTLTYDEKKGLIRGDRGMMAPRAHVLGGPL